MISLMIDLKTRVFKRIESFRKSLFFELLITSKRWSLIAFSFSVASIFFNLFTAALFLPSMIRVLDPSQKLPIFQKIDSFASKFFVIDKRFYFLFFVVVFILMLFKGVFIFLKEKFAQKLTYKHSIFLKAKMLKTFSLKSVGFYVREGSSVFLSALESYLQFSVSSVYNFIDQVSSLLGLVFSFSLMCYISLPLTFLVACLSFPLFYVTKKLRILFRKDLEVWGSGIKSMNQDHSNFYAGIRYLKLANKDELETSRILERSKKPFSSYVRYLLTSTLLNQINEIFGIFCVFVMVLFCYIDPFQSSSGHLSVFFSFLMVLARTLQYFNIFNSRKNQFLVSFTFLKKIESLLKDKSDMDLFSGQARLLAFEESIQFKGVSFVYPQTKRKVLNSIDLVVSKGKHLALVGPSGSGKSTLVDLILGFYGPTSGVIKLRDNDLIKFNLKDYRKLFGLVSQDATMFFPTIRENLILFKSDATEVEIRRALDQADALEFIDRLPDGIDTVIGERGIKLSGGQKQRLSIARALLHNPEILIFDEATSSLDSLSEARIMESIKKASVGRTTITVAHRLSTVMHCDKVIFLENGWVVEEGSPADLMKKQSRFRKYAEAQNLKMSG
jgi:subfamily B ATP-binding cassette protein MsbA